jgi:acetyltransferase-like isoleucine patch superfamily enzyme
MGIGSVALPGVRIGSWTTVGAGAVVVGDLPEHSVAIGIPARVRESGSLRVRRDQLADLENI